MTHQAPPAEVVVGLVAGPGAPADLAGALADELGPELSRRHPGLAWRLPVLNDRLVQPPAADADIVAAARQRLLERGWDVAVCLTDLPLRVAHRPVVAHASPVHGVAVVSVPALGAVGVHRRARDTVLRLVDGLVGETTTSDAGQRSRQRVTRRLRELAEDTDDAGAPVVRLTARLLTGNLRLLTGMVRANRPWRLAVGLSRALTAAVAAGVFALVTSDIWRLADAFGALRLTALAIVAVLAITVTLIAGGHLWERTEQPSQRRQIALFNLATTATVVIGVATLYAALFLLAAVLAAALVVPDLLAGTLEHPVHPVDYLELAWFTSSLATVGGALGAGLETDEAVREAAYTYHGSAD
ncbi:hypothetical protein O7630_11695 [Micromonospora sp. WMMD718]|uniref:hypothetical protein n=1 Tax=Micromonospora TaxID=1873 RepID=UPI00064B823E|nr:MULTISPECIES: hypothetical protein [unclassified Micromonospora]MDG4751604.1 hypothetical protein [Micromonospora sp. WMMD718]